MTTTTPFVCNNTCLNQTWLSTTPLFANWRFENNYLDESNNYHGTPTGSPTFVQGYAGRAISFTPFSGQMVSTAYIPLVQRSFAMNAWIYPTGLTNGRHHSICGLCSSPTNDSCLHMTLGKNGSSSVFPLYFGLHGDDVNSFAPASTVNNWIHAAFVFETGTRNVSIYRNGMLIRSGATREELKATNTSFQIGTIAFLIAGNNTFQVRHLCSTRM